MLILVTYDVETQTKAGQKRLRQVAKACQNYGQRVQNSVFECIVSEAQLVSLKNLIGSIIDTEADSVRIYYMGNELKQHVESMGKVTSFDYTQDLIL